MTSMCRVAFLLTLLGLPALVSAQGEQAPTWGRPVDGLRLGLQLSGDAQREPNIEVTFENAGPKDALLNLGFMLGNGRTMVADSVRLVVSGGSFGTCELELADRRFGGIAGRVDDLVVGLPRSTRYSVKLPVRDFWCTGRKQFPMPWPAEPLKMSARFHGRPAINVNLDMPAMKLMHFWRGTLDSGTVSVRIPSR